MKVEVETWMRKAFEASREEFLALIEEVKGILETEKASREESGLVRISTRAIKSVIVVGDIHGDIKSLIHVLKDVEVLNADRIVFLGDYGDRGTESVEVYYVVLKLKAIAGDKVVLLRGNHEGPPDMPVIPHDLPSLFKKRFGVEGAKAYNQIKELWEYLPYAVLVEGRYVMLHGGLPVNATSIADIAYAHESPSSSNLEEILWSDPVEGEGEFLSMRGEGRLFGEDVTERVLRAVGVKTLIRSHEPCEGMEVRQRGKVLTLFSRKGAPYFNSHAAYLILGEAELKTAKDAGMLARTAVRMW